MAESDKLTRIVEARMKLKARFEEKIRSSTSIGDARPQGSGNPNRHGMPVVPVGQTITTKWPVLDLGIEPEIPHDEWSLRVDGEVEHPFTLTWDELMALPQTEDQSDFHCVTSWSKLNMNWRGVRFLDIAALAMPKDTARFVLCHAYDDYTTNLSLEEALKPDVLLVHTYENAPLPTEHGGPLRIITPQLYAWKGAKWIKRIEFLPENKPGFWEERGYSNTAYPWRNDRYS